MMLDDILAWIIVTSVVFATWMCIIIFENLERDQRRKMPSPPPKAIYNPDNNEPIGFDFNHKDWDAPQWEAPEWTFDRPYMQLANTPQPQHMLVFDQILNANEIRTMNLQKILTEMQYGKSMILPEDVQIKVMRNGEWTNDYLSDIKAEPNHEQPCQICDILNRKYQRDVNRTQGYSQQGRHSSIKLPKPEPKPIIHIQTSPSEYDRY